MWFFKRFINFFPGSWKKPNENFETFQSFLEKNNLVKFSQKTRVLKKVRVFQKSSYFQGKKNLLFY